jgi:hypothetical protein
MAVLLRGEVLVTCSSACDKSVQLYRVLKANCHACCMVQPVCQALSEYLCAAVQDAMLHILGCEYCACNFLAVRIHQ